MDIDNEQQSVRALPFFHFFLFLCVCVFFLFVLVPQGKLKIINARSFAGISFLNVATTLN